MGKELPHNWVELPLEEVFNLYYGKGLGTKELLETGFDVYGANGIIGKYSIYNQEHSKVIISCRGANSGVMHFTHPKSFVTSNSIILDELSGEITDKMYAYYIMRAIDKSEVITGTAQPQITIQLLKNVLFPLPPLPEQKRIVTKLDTLFEHLENTKTRLEKVPTLLKNFRQAVLTQAVTGKLTEELNWSTDIIENLTEKVGSGSTPKGGNAAYHSEGIPLVRSMNIHFNGIKYDGLAFINDQQAHDLRSSEIFENDVLLNITGASIGRVCLAEDEIVGGRVNQHVSIIRANQRINPKYLNMYMASSIVQNIINDENYGVTRQALTKQQLLNIEVSFPSIEEQAKIVRRIESLFAKADAIEAKYKLLKEKIDNLPQTILSKAFKGELVEQLESDGDARELLEEIKKLKLKDKKKK